MAFYRDYFDRQSKVNNRPTRHGEALSPEQLKKALEFKAALQEAIDQIPEDQRPRIFPETLPERIKIFPLFVTPKLVHLTESNRAVRGIMRHAIFQDPAVEHRVMAARQAAARCPQTVRPQGQALAKALGVHL